MKYLLLAIVLISAQATFLVEEEEVGGCLADVEGIVHAAEDIVR